MEKRFDRNKPWYEQVRGNVGHGSTVTTSKPESQPQSNLDIFKLKIPRWLKKCQRCKSYSFAYAKTTRHKFGKKREHTSKRFICLNPKGNITKQANCFKLNPNWDTDKTKLKRIRKARFPIETVEKMRRTKKEVKDKMELEVQKPLEFKEGMHNGTISKIVYRDKPFNYTDIYIKVDGTDGLEIKHGVPTHVSVKSQLGKLLAMFTKLPKAGAKVDVDKVLIGKRLQFQTMNEISEKDGNTYARVISATIKKI